MEPLKPQFFSNIAQTQSVAILDAGAQYGKLIVRRVRELAVQSELIPLDASTQTLKRYAAFIISGGPESVYSAAAPRVSSAIFTLGKPILGICYGMQLMNFVAGGSVKKKRRREDGLCEVALKIDSELFKGLSKTEMVLMTHGDSVDLVGTGFKVIGRSDGLIAAIENVEKKIYGVQFHPEVDLTLNGKKMLSNFLFRIAGLSPTFSIEDREEKAIEYIRQRVGIKKVLILLSGGVDSTTCAALLAKALSADQIYAIHIDTGLMRKNESAEVERSLRKPGLNLKVIKAKNIFLTATTTIDGTQTLPLNRVTDPEQKRKIIGDTFVRVAQQAIINLGLDSVEVILAQGSLRPDLIESASSLVSSKAQTIKTHHNDTFLVRQLRAQGRVIEPLSEYHKDEVRELATGLGLSESLVWRQPFPGPGLGIRILAATKPYKTPDFAKIKKQIEKFSTEKYQVRLLPIRTVGVQGDGRSYSYLAGITCLVKPDWAALIKLARAIPKTVHAVNRVAFFFGKKRLVKVEEITPTFVNLKTLAQLRQADAIVNKLLLKHQLMKTISQVPVVLLPLSFGIKDARSIAIRTMITNDFMTGVPAIPGMELPEEVLQTMVEKILAQVSGIARVCYDLTSKPPGTTEWE